MRSTGESRRPSAEANHIFVISQLNRKKPPAWNTYLKTLARERHPMRKVYAPLRIGINTEMRSPGQGRAAMERSLTQLQSMKNFETIKAVSRQAFDSFVNHILPLIAAIENDYVNHGRRSPRFDFDGHLLTGAFHARVRLKTGESRYIYVHPSEWTDDETTAFVELLAVMGENAYGATRDQVWLLDLRNARIVKPPTRFRQLRRELISTITHLELMRKARTA